MSRLSGRSRETTTPRVNGCQRLLPLNWVLIMPLLLTVTAWMFSFEWLCPPWGKFSKVPLGAVRMVKSFLSNRNPVTRIMRQ